MSTRTTLRTIWWYIREVMGETAYDNYLAHHREKHPGQIPLTRRQFEDRRTTPNVRCC
jgi:uncharacterized short protein YbdD (DUF466 family)